jgi:hypothetical protein
VREWFAVAERPEIARSLEGHVQFGASPRSHDRLSERLTRGLTTAVAPGSWDQGYGEVGAVRELGGFLFVTQTFSEHEQVRRYVDGLRRDSAALQSLIQQNELRKTPATSPDSGNGRGGGR